MRRFLALATVFLMVGPAGTAAQAQSVAGSSLVRLSAESAASGGEGGASALDVNALLALQVRGEQGSWGRRGALVGALAGGLVAYLVIHQGGSTSLCDRSANQDAIGKRECVAITVAGGAAGAGVGAWSGGRFRR